MERRLATRQMTCVGGCEVVSGWSVGGNPYPQLQVWVWVTLGYSLADPLKSLDPWVCLNFYDDDIQCLILYDNDIQCLDFLTTMIFSA